VSEQHLTREEALAKMHELAPAFERCAMWLGLAANELVEIERIVAPSGRFQVRAVDVLRGQIKRSAGWQSWAQKLARMTAKKFPPPAPPPETQPDQET
jgi:hypothetical protein